MAFELSDHTKKMYNPAYEEGFLFGKEWWSKYERNRIIKLLENKAPNCNEEQYNFLGCDCSISYHDLIALIKGEK